VWLRGQALEGRPANLEVVSSAGPAFVLPIFWVPQPVCNGTGKLTVATDSLWPRAGVAPQNSVLRGAILARTLADAYRPPGVAQFAATLAGPATTSPGKTRTAESP